MGRWAWNGRRAGLAALPALLLAGAAAADPSDSSLPTLGGNASPPPPGWTSLCQSESRDAPLECRVEQRAVMAQTGQLVASVSVRVPGDTRKPVLAVRVPLGLSLEAGVTLDVDGGGGRSLPLQTCDGGGCYAGAPLPAELLAAMRGGDRLDVVFQNLDRKPIKLALPLAGFAEAYERVK